MDADAITAFVRSREDEQANPPPAQLKTLIDLCLAADETKPISAQDERHWYCHQQKSDVIRQVATYLIYLFSYNRVGQVGEWIKSLENVVTGCAACARGFCAARVAFQSK
jgi:senataxin